MHQSNNAFADVIHVEYRRIRIHADGVELVGVLHSDATEGFEVLLANCNLDLVEARLHDGTGSIFEQLTSHSAGFHSRRRRRVFLLVTNH